MIKNGRLHPFNLSCAELTGGSDPNCDEPLQGGVEPRVLMYNHTDILGVTTGSTPNLITGLTLKAGKSGFAFKGFGRSVAPQLEIIRAASGQPLYKHQVGVHVFEATQAQKNNLQNLVLGRVALITQSTNPDENAFELYGRKRGLEVAPGVIRNLNENNGAFTFTLATPDGHYETLMPQTIFNTDYPTTLDLIEDTLFLPAILNLSNIALAAAGGDAVTVTGKNFFGSGLSSDVVEVEWVKSDTLVATEQTSVTVSNATTLSFTSVALAAGTYYLRVTTSKGTAQSLILVTVS